MKKLVLLFALSALPLHAAAGAPLTTGISIAVNNPECGECFQTFKSSIEQHQEVQQVNINKQFREITIKYRPASIATTPALNVETVKQQALDSNFEVIRIRSIWPSLTH